MTGPRLVSWGSAPRSTATTQPGSEKPRIGLAIPCDLIAVATQGNLNHVGFRKNHKIPVSQSQFIAKDFGIVLAY